VTSFSFGEESTDLMNNPFRKIENGLWVDFSLAERAATILFTLGKYIELLIAPVTLTHDYYPRQIGIMNFGNWKVLLSLLAYIGMGVYALMRLPFARPQPLKGSPAHSRSSLQKQSQSTNLTERDGSPLGVSGARGENSNIIAFGVLFFIITLSIVSNIVFPIGTNRWVLRLWRRLYCGDWLILLIKNQLRHSLI